MAVILLFGGADTQKGMYKIALSQALVSAFVVGSLYVTFQISMILCHIPDLPDIMSHSRSP